MGFAGMAALTHEMEDVFELLRQRTRRARARRHRRAASSASTRSSAAVEAIDETGAGGDRAGGADRAPARRSCASARPSRRPSAPAPRRRPTTSPSWPTAAASCRSRATSTTTSRCRPCAPTWCCPRSPSSARRWPAAPSPDDVDTFAGREIDAWLVSEHTDAELADAAGSVPEVADVIVFEAVADAALDEPASRGRPVADAGRRRPTRRARPGAPRPRPPPPPRRRRRPPPTSSQGRLLDRPRRRRAARPADALHGRARPAPHAGRGARRQADVPGLSQAMQNLTRTSHALQSMVMQVRMIPVEAVFLRFPRLVRDLSTKLGKQVELELVGKDTELDRTVVDALGDPLVHLVRNSLDHGLEGPEERVAAGKPATGTLDDLGRSTPAATSSSRSRDDGRGIDPRRVASKAAERGLIARRRRSTRSTCARADRAALHRRLLDRRGHQRHLRPRRRHGRRARRDPRARRRGPDDLRARRGHAARRSACR